MVKGIVCTKMTLEIIFGVKKLRNITFRLQKTQNMLKDDGKKPSKSLISFMSSPLFSKDVFVAILNERNLSI